jgi:DNA-binding MarR family transcriptional regulator
VSLLDQFDQTFTSPARLAICAYLHPVESAEFSALRAYLEITDSALSKQLRILIDNRYVATRKVSGLGRLRTWVSLSPTGRAAFDAHVEVLQKTLASPSA